MTVVHETGHALDLALGLEDDDDRYYSVGDPTIRGAFRNEDFVTPYAAAAVDKFFAESLRAWCGANDAASLWADVSRDRLAKRTPTMLAFFDDLLVRLTAKIGSTR